MKFKKSEMGFEEVVKLVIVLVVIFVVILFVFKFQIVKEAIIKFFE